VVEEKARLEAEHQKKLAEGKARIDTARRKKLAEEKRQRKLEKQRIAEEKKKKREKALQEKEKVARIYAEGLKLYKAKNYTEAYQKFKKVRDLMPLYAQTGYYFHSCDYMIRFRDDKKQKEDSAQE